MIEKKQQHRPIDFFANLLKPVLVPIHREGWVFIALFFVLSLIAGLLWEPLWFVGVVLTVWCALFFRNPDRVTPTEPYYIISPADGVVQMISEAKAPLEIDDSGTEYLRIAVFMNVFNVHVNRIPIDGTVKKLEYKPGAFFNASLDKASEQNERQSVTIKLEDGREVIMVQIAGLVARRIVCDLEEDQAVETGQRMGLIRFGSRVDVYLPKNTVPLVCVGQTMIAGESILADISPTKRTKLKSWSGAVR